MSVIGKREVESGEGCHPEEKAYSPDYTKGALANWADKGGGGLRGRGGPTGQEPRKRFKWNSISEFHGFLETGKTLENYTR
jgi:hypothetical protein